MTHDIAKKIENYSVYRRFGNNGFYFVESSPVNIVTIDATSQDV